MNNQATELLQQVPLFAQLSQATITQLASGTRVYELEKDDILIQRGDPATSFFIICRGWAKVVPGGSGDKELVLNQIGPGQFIGETSFIQRGPHAATVIALTGLQAIEIKYDTFRAVLEQQPALALAFMEVLLDRLRQADIDRERQETLEHVILPLGVALSAERDLDRLLERIVVEAKSICHADAGTLYLRDEDKYLRFGIMRTDSLNLALGGTTGQAIPFRPLPLYDETSGEPNRNNVATSVTLSGQSINIPDVYNNQEFDFSGTKAFDREHGYATISCLTVPLKDHADKVIGVLQLLNPKDPATGHIIPFDDYSKLVVESLASQAAIALNNQILSERQRVLVKFERDVQIGRKIQLNFLPQLDELPQPPGWEIAAYFQAARQVAGDFFDVFSVQHKIGLVVADVCDKGVGAALFMSLTRSLLRAFAEQTHRLGWLDHAISRDQPAAATPDAQGRQKLPSAGTSALKAVEMTNKYIACNHGNMHMFATMFYGVLDPATGVLTYINGGHPAPAVISSTGELKTRLTVTGPVVGLMRNARFNIQQTRLEPGDLLFVFSDGVTDANSPNQELFEEEGLLPLLTQTPEAPRALLARIEASLKAHIATADQYDDITMLAVRRLP